jgi:hypothetical protein
MYRRLWIFAVVALVGLSSGGVAAQDASPAAADFVTPDPAECQVPPRTVDELVQFLATPAAGEPAAATPDALPTGGEPADPDTVAAVNGVTQEIYACINANAFLRVFALYTDAYISRSLVDEDVNPEALGLFATPIAPQAADERTSIAVSRVELLPDGRVGALVTSRDPLGDGADSPSYYIFTETNGRWLVDDVILNPTGAA